MPTVQFSAFALATGILFDAFVVRMVLVPSALEKASHAPVSEAVTA